MIEDHDMNKNPLLVLGAGSWGTALAMVLSRNKYKTYLWDIDQEHIKNLNVDGANERHLPGVAFPESLKPIDDLNASIEEIKDIIIVVPCEALHDVLGRMQKVTGQSFRICLACKGLEPKTHKMNHILVKEYLGNTEVAVLSGPSFAKEVAKGLPTAVTIASETSSTAEYFSKCFHNEVFRTYTNDDVVGVQIGGAIKNVMAIAAGIADGLGFGANTRAALITRGLAEITRLGTIMGGRQETFMGLTGLGDLVLTCTDNQSRNRQLGLALAQGKDLETVRQEIGQAIEGARTATAVHSLAREYNIEMPISEQIYKVLNGEQTPREAVQALLAREPKTEL